MTTPATQPVPPEVTTLSIREHIVQTPGTCAGKPRIAGHRIKVAHVAIWYERMGMTLDQIVAEYPSLTLADVHAALAYYYVNKDAIDADIAEGEAVAARFMASQPSLLEKIAQKRPDVTALPTRAALAYVRSGFFPADDIERLSDTVAERLRGTPDDADLMELAEAVSQFRKP